MEASCLVHLRLPLPRVLQLAQWDLSDQEKDQARAHACAVRMLPRLLPSGQRFLVRDLREALVGC